MFNGLDLIKKRINYRGGQAQQDRMIKDKRKTLDEAILYSYQGAKVMRVGDTEASPALMNPNKVLQDYDDKILSIGYEYQFGPGTVFDWLNTGTKWIIYLQDLTELAYFKGNVRKCSYEISWEDINGNKYTTYAAIKGPSQNGIANISRSGFNVDLPNYVINLLLPKTQEVMEQFQRYSRFYLQGLEGPDAKLCWRVEAVDSISTPGIIEIYAAEYYSNPDIDDIEQGVAGGLIIKPAEQEALSEIKGEGLIKPCKNYIFEYKGLEEGQWIYDNTLPMEVNIDGKTINIKWKTTYGGQFVLSYGSTERTIIVDSLF